jgi:hypothetical protein
MRTNSKTTTAVSVKNAPIIWASLIMVLIVLFVTQFAHAQVQNEPGFVPPSGNPCPPPVSQIQKPSRPIGTNGAYVECNPNIIINPTAGCRQEDTACHGYYVSNESAGMYTGWNMFTCGALFLIIGFLIAKHYSQNSNGGGNGNGAGGAGGSNTNHFNPSITVHPSHVQQASANTNINVEMLKKNYATWNEAREALKKAGVKNIEQYKQCYPQEVKNPEDKKS